MLQTNNRAEKGAMGARSFVEERVLSVCTRSNPAPEAGIAYTTPQVEGSPQGCQPEVLTNQC